MTASNSHVATHRSDAKFTDEQRARLRKAIARYGLKRAAKVLGTSQGLIATLASGGAITAHALDRLIRAIDAQAVT